RLPKLSRDATDRWVARARGLVRQLKEIPGERLSSDRAIDRTLLELLLESSLFDLTESRDYDRNPMAYVSALSLTAYMVREYAPIAQRVDAMVRTLEEVPRVLREGRARLDRVVPEPFLRLALAIGSGLTDHFAEAEEVAQRGSASLGERLRTARGPAVQAVADFLRALKDEYGPRAGPDFALGADRFQRLLWVREGIATPYAEIEAAGRKDLASNQARLQELARTASAGGSVHDLLERLYRDHPGATELVPETRALVEECRKFVEDKELVSIPPGAHCRVEETPVYGRALSTASMNPPGPYDTAGDEGIYFVTPIDAAWTAEKQEEWLRSLNRPMLRNITFHEVYPGHYLQFLHFRSATASTARKVYLSGSFAEGWAHYCEQLVIEQGYRADDPAAEAAQLHDALLRDCRLLVAIGLHAGTLTLAGAAQLFRDGAHMEALPAEREAIRGTFNPEYFCYTLGKLALLEARRKHLVGGGPAALRRFHDRVLSFGCPPVGLLDRLLAGS
ncbi:MAG: DUF885 domain-containing protein, partial [Thermoplasmata archaeon]